MENDELDLDDLAGVTGGTRNEAAKYYDYAMKKTEGKKISLEEVQAYISSMTPEHLENVDATLKKIDEFVNSKTQERGENENSRD